VNEREALAVLGLPSGVAMQRVRSEYRRLVRAHHPDVSPTGESTRAAQLTEAYAVLQAAVRRSGSDVIDLDDQPSGEDASSSPVEAERAARRSPYDEAVAAELAAGDSLIVHAPANETFGLLFEAAGRVGHLAYFDRQLGIIETIVRFEGGPSCSLLITLQGRVNGTEAFLTLESIEADPTPPLAPVVEALVHEIAALTKVE
jgi:hypothetical protein